MAIDYDAWLEKPYQDACIAQDEFDSVCESFIDSDSYWESYEQWASQLFKDGVHCSTEVWHDTDDFKESVEAHIRMLNEPQDPPEDREYRTRGWG